MALENDLSSPGLSAPAHTPGTKRWSISQRLKAMLAVIVGLIVLGDFFTGWADRKAADHESEAVRKEHTLLRATDRVRYDMLQMSDSLRGLLLDRSDKLEKRRKRDADDAATPVRQRMDHSLLGNLLEHRRR